MRNGWYQAAFGRDVTAPVTALGCTPPLFALRTRKGIRIFDAICPHRGANLGVTAKPDGSDAVLCQFHGRRIALGDRCASGEFVREHDVLDVGGLLFVRIGGRDNGLRAALHALDRDHYFIAGDTLTANVDAALVIENAFDQSHFQPVHDVRNQPLFTSCMSTGGEFAVTGTFMLPASQWQAAGDTLVRVPYTARAYSAGVVVSHMGGSNPYFVITSATPRAEGGSTIRLSLAIPAGANGRAPDSEKCEYLLRQTRAGIEKDIVIWNSLCADPAPSADDADAFVRAFRDFTTEMEQPV